MRRVIIFIAAFLLGLLAVVATAGTPDRAAWKDAWIRARRADAYQYPTNGFVAYWSMDSVSGDTVFDTWGDNDGTATESLTYTNGIHVNAANFVSASQEQIAVGNPYTIGTNDVSISMWFRTSYSEGQGFYSSNHDFTDNYIKLMMGGALASEGTIWVYTEGDANGVERGGGGGVVKSTANAYHDGEWHHLVVTRSGSQGYIYVDGDSEIVSIATRSDSICESGDVHRIGAYGIESGNFDGQIDEVAIWDRALSADEIEDMCNQQKIGKGFYEP